MLLSATEAAEMVLRVDEIIKGADVLVSDRFIDMYCSIACFGCVSFCLIADLCVAPAAAPRQREE